MAVIAYVKESEWLYNAVEETLDEKQKRTKHDQIFKELINNFFVEFLEVFFPKIHAEIDFKSIKPLKNYSLI